MKRVFWGSMLLGIGIGIFITSLVGIMLVRSHSRDIALSDAQIREKAKTLGMIDPTEGNYKQNIRIKTAVPAIFENKQSPDTERVIVAITKGVTISDVAKMLKNTGIINDSQEFIDKVRKAGLTAKLQPGIFEIKQNSSVEEVIDLLFDTK